MKQELAELEVAVVAQRDLLTRTKQERDGTASIVLYECPIMADTHFLYLLGFAGLRSENITLKQQSALIGADDLLRDFDDREV